MRVSSALRTRRGNKRDAGTNAVAVLEFFLVVSVIAGLVEAYRIQSVRPLPMSRLIHLASASVLLSASVAVPLAVLGYGLLRRLFKNTRRLRASPGFSAGFAITVAVLFLPLAIEQNVRRPGLSLSWHHLGPHLLILSFTAVLAATAGWLTHRVCTRHFIYRLRRCGRAVLGVVGLLAAVDLGWVLLIDAAGEDLRVQGGGFGRNAILISIDTLRADHLGSYGYGVSTDSEIQSFFSRGLRFAHAACPVPITRPSHAAMLTGRHPGELGMSNNTQPLPEGVPTLATLLRERGYATAGFVSGWPLIGQQSGLDRGFGTYSDAFSPLLEVDPALSNHTSVVLFGKLRWIDYLERDARAVTDEALAWLRRQKNRPFFLWVHYYDPHGLYEPPRPHARAIGIRAEDPKTSRPFYSRVLAGERDFTQRARAVAEALYDAEIRFVDEQLGRLFAELGEQQLVENTVVLLTADHGETLWERLEAGQVFTHGAWLDEQDVRVPFVIRGPDIPSGVEERIVAQSSDVAPTLLGALGLRPPQGASGRNLLRARNRAEAHRQPVVAFNSGPRTLPELVSARTADWKYLLNVENGKGMFFRVWADPARSAEPQRPVMSSARSLEAAARSFQMLPAAKEPLLSAAEKDRLRALGYAE